MAREVPMTDRARRFFGLAIAPLLIVVGLLLCLEGVWHGKMSEIFWIGPFVGPSLEACGWPRIGLTNSESIQRTNGFRTACAANAISRRRCFGILPAQPRFSILRLASGTEQTH
jgi:hypothetical protein